MSVADAFAGTTGEYRRPLSMLSYSAQQRIGRRVARDLHIANAVVHGTNAALVAAVVLALGGTGAVAFLAAVLFGFHPLASGSVAYVSGRTDLLATFFTLLAVLVSAGRRRADTATAVACCIAVAAAVLSKESGLLAGPVVSSVLWWRRHALGEGVPSAAIAAPAAVSLAMAAVFLPSAATSTVPLDLRLRGAGTALTTYARLLVWPSGLHLDRLAEIGGNGALAAGATFVTASALGLAAFLRRPSLAMLAVVAVLLLYFPGSGLVPVQPAIADRLVSTGEQFLYAPLAGIAMALAATIAWLTGSRPLVPIAAAVLAMLVWTLPVVLRQRDFSSAERVYRATLAHSPSPRACVNLGNLQFAHRAIDAAATTYQSCVHLAPEDAEAHGQLAVALQRLGFREDAQREYERSIELDDGIALVWSNYAALDANAGRYAEARQKWIRALSIDPRDDAARAALARLDAAGK